VEVLLCSRYFLSSFSFSLPS